MSEGHRFTAFERECLHSLEDHGGSSSGEDESEARAPAAQGGGSGVLWDDYEAAAMAAVRLYQGKGWREFAAAAAATTQLYKDSVEATRRAKEAGRAAGRQGVLKELVGYLRSGQGRGPFVRRQDLLAFLAGRSPPPASSSASHRRSPSSAAPPGSSPLMRLRLDGLCLAASPPPPVPPHDGLRMFHQALSRLEAEGMGGGGSPRAANGSPNSRARQPNLQRFFVEQVRRHRKRGMEHDGSPPDSPTSSAFKRRRL